MKRVFVVTALCYILLISLLFWSAATSGNADWLRVETAPEAVSGENFHIRVTLLKDEPGMKLGADIHWMTSGKESRGYLSGCRPVEVIAGKNVYDFSVPVHNPVNAAYIFPVISLSRDGTWTDRTAAASVEPVKIVKSSQALTSPALTNKTVKEITGNKVIRHAESAVLGFIIAGLWFAVAAICVVKRRLLQTGSIAAAAICTALWEISNAGSIVENTLRNMVIISGRYGGRHYPQLLFTVVFLAVVAALSLYLLSTINDNETLKIIVWMSMLLFWIIAIMRVISFHETDAVLGRTLSGVEAGQIIRLTASIAGLAAILNLYVKFRNINSANRSSGAGE